MPPAGLLRYARFSWKIARLPAPSHYARRACDSNYVNTAPGRGIRHDEADYVRPRPVQLPGAPRPDRPFPPGQRDPSDFAGRMENSRGQGERIDRAANKVRLSVSRKSEIIDETENTDPRCVRVRESDTSLCVDTADSGSLKNTLRCLLFTDIYLCTIYYLQMCKTQLSFSQF